MDVTSTDQGRFEQGDGPAGRRITVLVVEDHELAREGIKCALASEGDIQVVAESGDVDQALTLIDAFLPNVVLLDIGLGRRSGIDVAAAVKAHYPTVRVVVLTAHDEPQYVRRFAKLGVVAYLVKTASCAELREAVRHAARSAPAEHKARRRGKAAQPEGPFSPSAHLPLSPGSPTSRSTRRAQFTERELEVLGYMTQGLKYRQIAETLGLSTRTVEVFADHIFIKLGAHSRTQAVTMAFERGLVSARRTVLRQA